MYQNGIFTKGKKKQQKKHIFPKKAVHVTKSDFVIKTGGKFRDKRKVAAILRLRGQATKQPVLIVQC